MARTASKLLAGDEVPVGHPAVQHSLERGLGLGARALRHAHRVGHDLGQVVHEAVAGLHVRIPSSCGEYGGRPPKAQARAAAFFARGPSEVAVRSRVPSGGRPAGAEARQLAVDLRRLGLEALDGLGGLDRARAAVGPLAVDPVQHLGQPADALGMGRAGLGHAGQAVRHLRHAVLDGDQLGARLVDQRHAGPHLVLRAVQEAVDAPDRVRRPAGQRAHPPWRPPRSRARPSPALAASTPAFRARRFVWKAMSSIISVTCRTWPWAASMLRMASVACAITPAPASTSAWAAWAARGRVAHLGGRRRDLGRTDPSSAP